MGNDMVVRLMRGIGADGDGGMHKILAVEICTKRGFASTFQHCSNADTDTRQLCPSLLESMSL